MVVKEHKDRASGVSFPMYENKKILQPNEKLTLYLPLKLQLPLSGAAEVGEAEAEASTAKKRRS